MASWSFFEHATNALLWAIVGGYALSTDIGIPMPLKLGGIALVYSYGSEYIEPYIAPMLSIFRMV